MIIKDINKKKDLFNKKKINKKNEVFGKQKMQC